MARLFVFILIFVLTAVPSFAQLGGSPSGDFRVNDRPGTSPTVGPPGGPSLAGPGIFPDPTGAKSPDELLKRLDKDLGRSTVSPLGGRTFESPRDHDGRSSVGSSSEDILKR
jgi:hypothetical protein